MTRPDILTGGARRGQRGFTLITVLVAIFLFGFGLLAVLRSLGSVTGGATQNQNVAATATLSNAFWGVVQANPALLTDPAMGTLGTPITFSSANITSAPTALQPWLYSLVDTGSATATGLPGGQATITVSPDVSSLNPCPLTTGCYSVTLTLQWTQVASALTTRQQTFYYQSGI